MNLKMFNVKSEKGSITLFVLIAILFFLVVLFGKIYTTTGLNSAQIKEIDQIQRQYSVTNGDLENEYNNALGNIYELKVGDFVEYELNAPSTEQLAKLNNDIATYSGATDNTEKTSVGTTLLCRVLEVDSTGNPTKLISADGVNSLSLSGADGYNNAVYLINEMCTTLYSGNKGTTRSLTIEDLENNYFNSDGLNERDTYTDTVTYGETKYYEINAKYPSIAQEEARMGIATTLVDGKNLIRTGGLGLSEQATTYAGSGVANSSTVEATNKGITVTQTYYYNKNKSASEIYNKEDNENVYYNIFHQNPAANGSNTTSITEYWLASRCVRTYSTSCSFVLRYFASTEVNASNLFYSDGYAYSHSRAARPVVSLSSGTKAQYAGKYNDTYNKWTLK